MWGRGETQCCTIGSITQYCSASDDDGDDSTLMMKIRVWHSLEGGEAAPPDPAPAERPRFFPPTPLLHQTKAWVWWWGWWWWGWRWWWLYWKRVVLDNNMKLQCKELSNSLWNILKILISVASLLFTKPRQVCPHVARFHHHYHHHHHLVIIFIILCRHFYQSSPSLSSWRLVFSIETSLWRSDH